MLPPACFCAQHTMTGQRTHCHNFRYPYDKKDSPLDFLEIGLTVSMKQTPAKKQKWKNVNNYISKSRDSLPSYRKSRLRTVFSGEVREKTHMSENYRKGHWSRILKDQQEFLNGMGAKYIRGKSGDTGNGQPLTVPPKSISAQTALLRRHSLRSELQWMSTAGQKVG